LLVNRELDVGSVATLPGVAETVEGTMSRARIAGLAIGVVLGGRSFAGGFGVSDIASGAAMTPATLFRIASVTKIVTGTLVLKARDRGLLSLDDPVARFLPAAEALSAGTRNNRPTFRQCLTHTAGLAKELPGIHFGTDSPTVHDGGLAAALEHLTPELILFPPYTRVHYSNVGYMLAGTAAAAAFGGEYAEVTTREVLAPLGIHESGFTVDGNLATGYYANADGSHRPAPQLDYSVRGPNGGLIASVQELLLLIRANLYGSMALSVLDEVSVRESHLPIVFPGSGSAIAGPALGWQVEEFDGELLVTHGGNTAGFDAAVTVLPERNLGVTALSNTNNDVIGSLNRNVIRLLLTAQNEGDVPPASEGAPEDRGWEQLVGRYDTPEWSLDIFAVSGEMRAICAADPDTLMRFEPIDAGQYRVQNGWFEGEVLASAPGSDEIPYKRLTLQGWELRRHD
jgi:CubicO group peptidase (beta-lactamase class C family)